LSESLLLVVSLIVFGSFLFLSLFIFLPVCSSFVLISDLSVLVLSIGVGRVVLVTYISLGISIWDIYLGFDNY
jgi:hypothetical protein